MAKGQAIGTVRVWYGNTCLAQQELLSASDVAVEQTRQESSRTDPDVPVDLVNSILKIVLIAVAVVFVLMILMRIWVGAKRRRRRARRNRRASKPAPRNRRER